MSDTKEQNYILIGPPGSGKSTIGRALSKALNRNLSDTDALIESGSRHFDIANLYR
jgi:shikimate kinase